MTLLTCDPKSEQKKGGVGGGGVDGGPEVLTRGFISEFVADGFSMRFSNLKTSTLAAI